tara:strand:- start:1254 stop:2447 length:1194 start_codon:yes stop_codon:yes gene_type:complete
MAKKKKKATEEVVDKVVEQPIEEKVDESKFKSAGDDSVIKVDLNKEPSKEKSEEVKEEPAKEEEVVVVNEETKPEPEPEKEVVEEDIPTIQEITDEEVSEEEVEEQIEEAVAESEMTGKPLPENIQKLVNFMDETGGDINDYVQLNRDISKLDDSEVLDEYYRATKSHLTPEERNFLLEDQFGVDEEMDDDKVIRKKKIALKEQVAEAKAHLDRQKSKYYEEIKAGSKLTQEQQKAIDFFNRYEKQNEEQKKKTEASKKTFLKRTNNVFNEDFKGFDYKVGDKKFRFNVKDMDKVKSTQSDLNNFVDRFVDEDKVTIKDAEGYHKSLFTAMNADAIAKHFYEQGKADAIKSSVAKDKNINLDPRQTHGEYETGGVKVRVLGDSANDFKFKIKSKNKK